MRLAVAILLLVMPLMGQRAQLARKGRKAEPVKGVARTPVRKLPRRKAATPAVAAPIPLRKYPAPRPLSEDRVRPLLKGTVTPVPAVPAGEPHHNIRAGSFTMAVRTTGLPGVEATPIANRWQIFPSAP